MTLMRDSGCGVAGSSSSGRIVVRVGEVGGCIVWLVTVVLLRLMLLIVVAGVVGAVHRHGSRGRLGQRRRGARGRGGGRRRRVLAICVVGRGNEMGRAWVLKRRWRLEKLAGE